MAEYYVFRRGGKLPKLDYSALQRLFAAIFEELEEQGWFQKSLGKDCTDDPRDIGAIVLEKLGADMWPMSQAARRESEEWLFTLVEFAYRNVSKPTETRYHAWDDCGVHVLKSDEEAGRQEFRERANALLSRYERPHELRADGEIWEATPTGLETIEHPPTGQPPIDNRVQSAIRSFRRHGATEDDKRHAIHDLADVLEYLRKSGGTQLSSKDESDLFNIANNFGIRHHNPGQKTTYNSGIWLDWIFYSFLNTIATITKLFPKP